jgi:hypothetical protein
MLPSGNGAQAINMPGPPGSALSLAGATEMSAVMPGPGLGPRINNVQTDMITTLQADSTFEHIYLTAFAADGTNVTVWNPPLVNGVMPSGGANITNNGPDDIRPGDLLVLTRGNVNLSAFVQVTRVAGQQVFFAAGDSLNLNQQAAADGTARELQNTLPADGAPPAGATTINTQATRVRMISYYIDNVTDPLRPRLIRRMNNGSATTFDNTLGTAVAFDVENLTISYDLANSATNPANVRMEAVDFTVAGRCAPSPCSRNQIRKVNILLGGRSRLPLKGTFQFLRNRLQTQVSMRSLAFVDKYK